jgi:phospholipid-binding lipoprotein MlaA
MFKPNLPFRCLTKNGNTKIRHVFCLSLLAVNCFAGTTSRSASIESRRTSSKNVVPFRETNDDSFLKETSKPKNRDPLRPLNKVFFSINNQLYRFIFKPLAKVTTTLIPKPIRTGIGNVIENAETPVRVAGCLLQGKFKRAGQETAKLLVNSTVGVGGLFKPSQSIETLKDVPVEDVGQAIATWGIPAGPYVVLPVIGPSNVREIVGHGGDIAANPATWLGERSVRILARGTKIVQENPYRMDLYDAATKHAVDPYTSVREAYQSYRQHEIDR